MEQVICCYRFKPHVPLQDVQETLLLAVLAAEGLHGPAIQEANLCYGVNADLHALAICAGDKAGRDVVRIFTNFVRREFGGDALDVTILAVPACCKPTEARE